MQLSEQQESAAKSVANWFVEPDPFAGDDEQVFRLFGYAGTGKTTIAKDLVARLKLRSGEYTFAAFTGKAAHVLTKKGCPASTIHRLIYRPTEVKEKGKDGKEVAKVVFKLRGREELEHLKLIIVDEVSMVGEDLARDLLSFDIPILVLGDPAQLPPISGEGFFTDCEPDFMLTEIHRQAEESPIIQLATTARARRPVPIGEYGESAVRFKVEGKVCMEADQVLVGRNATRRKYNQAFRRQRNKGNNGQGLPEAGDKIVCLRNNHEIGLLNGSLWIVQGVREMDSHLQMDLTSDDGEVELKKIDVYRDGFIDPDIKPFRMREAEVFDYGYALTCHKSQGSQWNHVVVIDESEIAREHRYRWMYTAITRAAEKVTVYMRG